MQKRLQLLKIPNTNVEFLSKYPDLRQLWYIRSDFVWKIISDISISLLESLGKPESFCFSCNNGRIRLTLGTNVNFQFFSKRKSFSEEILLVKLLPKISTNKVHFKLFEALLSN